MLRSLHVRNYVLIDSLEIDFPEGLVIITGQTGAGKSILLGALGLALGGKADASLVGVHGDSCVVEAEFTVPEDLRALMAEYDLEDSDMLLIRRTLNRTGRSRSFVNDEPVSLPVLQALSEHLIDIHSQHQTLRLADPAFRMSMLDHYAASAIPGLNRDLTACREAWNTLQDLRKELAEVKERLQKLSAEKEYNEARFTRLENAKLRDGELEELEEEQKRLAHAEELKEYLNNCEDILAPSDDRTPLTAELKEAGKQVARAARFIPSLEPLVQRLESARLELEDIVEELDGTNAKIEVSPDRLEQVEDRMSLLYDLMKKHGVGTVAELIEVRDRLSEALFDSTALEERRVELEKSVTRAEKAYDAAANALHTARQNASEGFASAILASLSFLELDHAVFTVELAPAAEGPSGRDAVRFLFSSTGKAPQDLSKVASGGELSRIMLSLKAMMARFTAMPALIFDEIDTGVSGSAADRMGQMICRMGEDMQVFAITHLPQVAAKGNAHYLVTKENDVTAIRSLSREERIRELARLLSGSVITDAAIANAQALLGDPAR
ncbi:MAG: DNA repair protein RecN [Bacteroidales bacterium]|nr:DNA repair protein RecN [Bacteroidales bacterium]